MGGQTSITPEVIELSLERPRGRMVTGRTRGQTPCPARAKIEREPWGPTPSRGVTSWAWSTARLGIITGATSGIGQRTAELFVEEGAKVVFTGRRKAEGEALATRLGARARFVQADATLEADWKRVIAETCRRFGPRLDYLFNNAGGPAPTGSITTIPVDGFDAAMALLVRSVMLGMKHAAPHHDEAALRQHHQQRLDRRPPLRLLDLHHLQRRQGGREPPDPLRRHGARRAQRARQLRVARRHHHRHPRQGAGHGRGQGRHVAKVAEQIGQFYAKAQPIPRAGMPDDIAQCVLWLASDRSTFVNGIDIVVDGGIIGGRMFTPHQEGLKQTKAALGI